MHMVRTIALSCIVLAACGDNQHKPAPEVNDAPPAAVDDTFTVAESALPNMLDVLANDTDIDAGPKTIAMISQPVHGSASVAAGGTAVTYSSGIGYCNLVPNVAADTFTYT